MSDRPGEKRSLSDSLKFAMQGISINHLPDRRSLPESERWSLMSPEERHAWQTNRSFVARIIQSEIPNFPEGLLQMIVKKWGIVPNQFSIKFEDISPADRVFWDKIILASRLPSLHRKWEKDDKGQTLFLEIKRSKDGNSINCSVGRMDHEVLAFDPQHKALDKRIMAAVQKELLAPLGISNMIISAKSYEEYAQSNSTVPNCLYVECLVKHHDATQLDDDELHAIQVPDDQGESFTYSVGLTLLQKVDHDTFRILFNIDLIRDYLTAQ
jgi:hypothetical protein